jgi:pilus assembly protein Flp/PilA
MTKFLKTLTALRIDRKGVTALEYALIGSIVAVGIVATVTTFSTQLQTTFTGFTTSLSGTPAK